MANLKKRIKKDDFEKELIEKFGHKNLSIRKYNEPNYDTGKIVPLSLYYYKDVHVATWTKGECWIFDFALDPKTLQAKVDEQNAFISSIKEEGSKK